MSMTMGQATEQPSRVTTDARDLYNKTKTRGQHRPTYPTHCAKKKSASGRQGLSGPRDGVIERAPVMVYIAPRRPTPIVEADTELSRATGTPRATRRRLQGGDDAMTPPPPSSKDGPRVSPEHEEGSRIGAKVTPPGRGQRPRTSPLLASASRSRDFSQPKPKITKPKLPELLNRADRHDGRRRIT